MVKIKYSSVENYYRSTYIEFAIRSLKLLEFLFKYIWNEWWFNARITFITFFTFMNLVTSVFSIELIVIMILYITFIFENLLTNITNESFLHCSWGQKFQTMFQSGLICYHLIWVWRRWKMQVMQWIALWDRDLKISGSKSHFRGSGSELDPKFS